MADDEHASAIDTVARHVLWAAVQLDDAAWEDYPELGEHDWHAIIAHADRLADELMPDGEYYDAAYEYLAGRATTEP